MSSSTPRTGPDAPTPPPRYDPLPPPSDVTLPRGTLPAAPPAFAVRAALALRELLLRAADAVIPGELAVFDRVWGAASAAMLGAVARHGIVDAIGDGALTAEQIARATGTDADVVHRTLRALATRGVFTLSSDGRFANNRLSRGLSSGRLTRVREFVLYFTSGSNLAAWGAFARTMRDGLAPFERVHGATVWEWFDRHPDEREMFAHGMMGVTLTDAPFVAALYPFAQVRTLCDVGGGRGTLLSELLLRHPHLRGVLCDGPGVIASARAVLEARGVADRVELVAGSFFDEVPAGADAYLLKNILHDWDDARCAKILRTVRRAAAPGARLLVVETLTERNAAAGYGPMVDVQMLVACAGGRERGREEFARLLDASGFRLARVFEGATLSVLEATAV